MRGPGEKEIETDRRIVRDKIAMLKGKLEKIDLQNTTQRKNRGDLIRVALVGYTNAGKSTLMNLLAKSEVFAEDKLFATLDTTVRKVVLERMPFLLSDTVGFIRKLPHHLVESFKSTLDETRESDLILHVVDISHPQYEDHIETVETTLRELECGDKPVIMIFNKIDNYRNQYFDQLLDSTTKYELEQQLNESLSKRYQVPCLFVSARTSENIVELRQLLIEQIRKLYEIRYPYQVRSF
jgi:GTP-binding protein HflX